MPNDEVYVVLVLNRWEGTDIQLTMPERLEILRTGKLNLANMFGYDSIGWSPVFRTKMDAEAYCRDNHPNADVVAVGKKVI